MTAPLPLRALTDGPAPLLRVVGHQRPLPAVDRVVLASAVPDGTDPEPGAEQYPAEQVLVWAAAGRVPAARGDAAPLVGA